MLGLAAWRTVKQGNEPMLANAWHYFASMYKFAWFVVFVLLTMSFGAVAAGLLWRQRLAALRGRLEPHFMFNTLSAIGALVNLVDKPLALDGPLVESALHHDLECHEDASDIDVAFAMDAGRLLVRVSKPMPHHAAPKAGLGIGLRGTRARLDLAYGEDASLTAGQVEDRFVAELRMPLAGAA